MMLGQSGKSFMHLSSVLCLHYKYKDRPSTPCITVQYMWTGSLKPNPHVVEEKFSNKKHAHYFMEKSFNASGEIRSKPTAQSGAITTVEKGSYSYMCIKCFKITAVCVFTAHSYQLDYTMRQNKYYTLYIVLLTPYVLFTLI